MNSSGYPVPASQNVLRLETPAGGLGKNGRVRPGYAVDAHVRLKQKQANMEAAVVATTAGSE